MFNHTFASEIRLPGVWSLFRPEHDTVICPDNNESYSHDPVDVVLTLLYIS